MKITRQEIIHVANLARLELNDAEVESMTSQVGRILSYVEKLNELDTTGVRPTTHTLAIRNAFREDVTVPSLSRGDSLANGPEENGEAFVVPRVI